jgi:hypothetical protein
VNRVTKEDTMSLITADAPTRVPAIPDREGADHPGRDREPGPSRIWALLEALAYAGAFIDPTGRLAAQRFAGIREEYQRRGRR